MVSVPADTPVTMPPAIVALALLAVQVPPELPSVRFSVLPMHTDEDAGKMEAGVVITVTILVAAQPAAFV